MIRTRLVVGTILAAAAAGMLIGDDHIAPGWYPFLFTCLIAMGVLAGRELVHLFPESVRPPEPLVLTGIVLCLTASWYPRLSEAYGLPVITVPGVLVGIFTAVLLAALLIEMRNFTGEPGQALPRIGATLLAVAYLGLLASYFAQIRFLSHNSALQLAAVIFVPKGNDIAAFFTGTFLGRHKMMPLLSPKKTWEGFVGGMLGGVAIAVGFALATSIFPGGVREAVGFGLVVGLAGVLGDLAESLIKRDCKTKDASRSIPGFGGFLDVVDSVLFAAPVAYLWFAWH